ncbi:HMG-box domain-containing protein [Paraburkholderia dipogonis]|uniref:hypothetical protein n=1 Tax=Paraburkholderia dipogonis TaxID=1211383 RepID=UPI0038BA4B73
MLDPMRVAWGPLMPLRTEDPRWTWRCAERYKIWRSGCSLVEEGFRQKTSDTTTLVKDRLRSRSENCGNGTTGGDHEKYYGGFSVNHLGRFPACLYHDGTRQRHA